EVPEDNGQALADAGVPEPAAGVPHQERSVGGEAGAEAVARGEVEVALGVGGDPAAAHPDARRAAVGGGVEDLDRSGGDVARVVTADPALLPALVPLRGKGDIADSLDHCPTGTLFLPRV